MGGTLNLAWQQGLFGMWLFIAQEILLILQRYTVRGALQLQPVSIP